MVSNIESYHICNRKVAQQEQVKDLDLHLVAFHMAAVFTSPAS